MSADFAVTDIDLVRGFDSVDVALYTRHGLPVQRGRLSVSPDLPRLQMF
jgi:hypothetical protein